MIVNPNVDPIANIKVVGVGGGGGNAINTMIDEYDIPGVEFMAFNTDAQALKKSKAPVKLQLGENLTNGLGVGGDPKLGAEAAEESIDQIKDYLSGADMVFVTAGMGGGTGTGATPIIAGIAKQMGALTVGVVTTPFNFEGVKRMKAAVDGIDALRDKVDTLIIIPNQRLIETTGEDLSFLDAMKQVDRILAEAVNSIAGLISETGLINVDFNDVKSIMTNAGTALMGSGVASGENRAEEAARAATSSPLLNMSIEGATGVLFQIAGGLDLKLNEVDKAANLIKEAVDPNAEMIFGAEVNEQIPEGEIRLTIIATGFGDSVTTQSVVTENFVNNKPPVSQSSIPSSFLSDDVDSSKEQPQNTTNPTTANKPQTPVIQVNTEKSDYPVDELEKPAFLRNK